MKERDFRDDLEHRICAALNDDDEARRRGALPDLPVVARCRCGQSNCAHFHTAPPRPTMSQPCNGR